MSLRPSENLIKRLANEIDVAGTQNLLPRDDAERIAKALKRQERHIKVILFMPTKVKADILSDLADLRYTRCSHCGKVHELYLMNTGELKSLRCSKCGRPLIPAPVWCVTGGNLPSQSSRRITTRQGVKIVLSIEDYMRDRGRGTTARPDAVVVKDRSRPVASLRLMRGGHEDSISHAKERGNFKYLLLPMPLESVTKPITITAFAYNVNKCIEVSTTTGELKGIEKILFCDYLEVLQTTILYKAGHPKSSSQERISVIHMQKGQLGETINIPARYLVTKGLVIKVNSNLLKEVLGEVYYKGIWTTLHTMSHAFLVNLPRITGLEGSDFGEAISTEEEEIAIYDNSMGGLGGVEGVISSGNLVPNYEWSVREAHRCPLACIRACRACLYTDSCFMLNWGLDRKVLRKLEW